MDVLFVLLLIVTAPAIWSIVGDLWDWERTRPAWPQRAEGSDFAAEPQHLEGEEVSAVGGQASQFGSDQRLHGKTDTVAAE